MRPRLRLSRPFWLDRGTAAPSYPMLRGRHIADVAVVGAGITGAAVASRFASAGLRVVVLEAAQAGRGSTAASTALLMQEPDADLTDLARRYGDDRARRIWELGREATRDLVSTIRRLRIHCDLERHDSVYFALTDRWASRLRAEHAHRVEARLGGRWLSRKALRRATGIDGLAGIRTTGNAVVDPYRCCLGLLRAAVDAGAAVFERSEVSSIDASRRGVQLRTQHGDVLADQVIVATGYATPYFEPLAARFRMMHTYVVVTRRLGAAERRRMRFGRLMIWETGWPYHYARWTPDGRLMLGGGDRHRVPDRARRTALVDGTRRVRDYFVERFPALDRVPIEYAWEGLFAMTPDGLAYIGPHRRYPRHLFALGYGGNGMTLGFLASRLLLDWYQGKRSTDHELFAFNRV